MVTVSVKDLAIDRVTYPRDNIDPERVTEFGKLMLQGEVFPAIQITQDKRVVDGAHRLLGTISIGRQTIEAEVIDTKNLLLSAASSNCRHGLPLSMQERRVVCLKVVAENPGLPLVEIAWALSVSRRTAEDWTQAAREESKGAAKAMVQELRQAGRSEEEIAKEVQVDQGTVSRWLQEAMQERMGAGLHNEERNDTKSCIVSPSPDETKGENQTEKIRLKGDLKSRLALLALGEDALCPLHEHEGLAFLCGLSIEEAVLQYANRLRLLEVKEVQS